MSQNRKRTGFTLIELVVAVAIVGILAAIAYPSYQEYVRRGKRTIVTGDLLQLAQRMERCYTRFNSYTAGTAGTGCPVNFPMDSSEGGDYQITAPTLAASNFTLQALPVGGRSMAGDTRCTGFTYSSVGVKGVAASSTHDADYCW